MQELTKHFIQPSSPQTSQSNTITRRVQDSQLQRKAPWQKPLRSPIKSIKSLRHALARPEYLITDSS